MNVDMISTNPTETLAFAKETFQMNPSDTHAHGHFLRFTNPRGVGPKHLPSNFSQFVLLNYRDTVASIETRVSQSLPKLDFIAFSFQTN